MILEPKNITNNYISMSDEHFLFWIVCLGLLFIGKLISNHLFLNTNKIAV